MNDTRYKMVPGAAHIPGVVEVVPRATAAAVARAANEEYAKRQGELASEFFGQQAGVPGMGDAPALWHEPAGSVLGMKILHPAFTIVEREFRSLPQEGWFSALRNPRNPDEFELGSFAVPKDQVLWLVDYEFTVFRPSGLDPGDAVAAEAGRFTNQMGFDVTIGGTRRPGNISYQLDPAPPLIARSQFAPPIGDPRQPPDAFNAAQSKSFASTASPGSSLLPVRSNVQGPRGGPFTFIVGQEASVALSAVIFNPLLSPVSFISGRLAGWLLHINTSSALLQRVRPR